MDVPLDPIDRPWIAFPGEMPSLQLLIKLTEDTNRTIGSTMNAGQALLAKTFHTNASSGLAGQTSACITLADDAKTGGAQLPSPTPASQRPTTPVPDIKVPTMQPRR